MQLEQDDRITCPPDVLSRVLDGEAVLLHLGTGTYFGMNEVATRAWQLISEGSTIADLGEALEREFDVARDVLDRDLRELVEALIEKGLVTVTPARG